MKITASDIAREAIITVAGAVLAAVVIGQLPGLRAWIEKQWGRNA